MALFYFCSIIVIVKFTKIVWIIDQFLIVSANIHYNWQNSSGVKTTSCDIEIQFPNGYAKPFVFDLPPCYSLPGPARPYTADRDDALAKESRCYILRPTLCASDRSTDTSCCRQWMRMKAQYGSVWRANPWACL